MNKILQLGLLGIVAAFSMTSTSNAIGPCCCFCEEGRCQVKVEREEVETKEFTCECETICIPPIRFPWQCGPLKNCGKIRTIKKLGTVKGKKSICVYDWTAIQCCPSCSRKVREGCRFRSVGCGSSGVPCDKAITSRAQVPILNSGFESHDSLLDAGGESAPAARYPEVSVALVDAIRAAAPEADGWVQLDALQSKVLASKVGRHE